MPQEKNPQLISQEPVGGASEVCGSLMGRQFRDGKLRLVTLSANVVVVRTVRSSPQPPLFGADSLYVPLTDLTELQYVTPTRVGVAVSRRGSVSYHSRSGVVEWSFQHDPWGDNGSGACAETPDGRRLLAIVPGTLDDVGEYAGDRCVLLETETGKVVDEMLLPSFSAMYTLNAPFPQASTFFLDAGQGQDDAYSWRVDVTDGYLHLVELATGMERVTGAHHHKFLLQDIGGPWLQIWHAGPEGTMHMESVVKFESEVNPPKDTSAEEDKKELCLIGDSGFVDDSHIIAAVAEDWSSKEADHYLLDAKSLTIRFRIKYPFLVGPESIALTDGTWVTVTAGNVCRWRVA
ncbi:hypothetical protein HFD88_005949 [Aspergillus terreus]|nr:hypothetical protein HFD88_005949 [Aspergillus terreus]